jgi:hypothetical protein
MLAFLNRLLGRNKNTALPFNFARNRYPAKKKWPPNLRELTDKQNYRFERKFKRRVTLKSVRPQWNRWTKIVQWSTISFIVVYGVLFHDFAQDPMNPRPGQQPFAGLRNRMWEILGNFWTHTDTNMVGERGARRQEPLQGGRVVVDDGEQASSSRGA